MAAQKKKDRKRIDKLDTGIFFQREVAFRPGARGDTSEDGAAGVNSYWCHGKTRIAAQRRRENRFVRFARKFQPPWGLAGVRPGRYNARYRGDVPKFVLFRPAGWLKKEEL